MKPPIRQLKKWIAALDSGEYKPDISMLLHDYDWPVSKEWLFELDDDFISKTEKSFFALYNVWDYTFSEIATLLELVYIHKILD